jgi:3',5'-cyclic-AMP phosphodiesterase
MIVAQISDFHVDTRVQTPTGEVDTCERLRHAVAHLNGLRPIPDVVLVTGDLTEAGTVAQYAIVRQTLAKLRMPHYLIPGNHDDRENLRAVFSDHRYLSKAGEFVQYVVEHHELRFIALDTLVPGADDGRVCAQRRAWLAARLSEAPERPTLIFMHHPPFLTGLAVFDRVALDGAEALGEIVAQHTQIVAITCGHVHRPIKLHWRGTLACTAPSISFQYPLTARADEDIHPVDEPPACWLYGWTRAAGLAAHLSFIGASGEG